VRDNRRKTFMICPIWRELKARFDGVQSEEDAFEAINALHDVLTAEELLA